ncbi:POT family proton-dependent oligopeptide transporter [Parabacteroides sp. PF5-5]|uniref:MFS transporter n=1 Tax=unclassified Parabacteroides TaxID=2649774 RepID=UPI002473EDFA|nr:MULTISPECIES: MFS transporter [unclassified Parabacteroides]MDH6303405.1 POT family proton-dependent oligopeptide transporter [Parabacteroides sp. PH5-39]MDH6314728.1 POT family proton-dependent oligopeptide transporter [Parabacteroides sp. PF5-13]MDH6318065.1 POT family proton-dependent oligopeptide transporter [Parabacteroides sp. PH5-13]MDH6322004.1 POT family proton-dependent oligopeptide transporter [Parabacteroides sp. PH5-8]MDH6326127.1 POT family proton-dependent oligopeptide transp
MNVFSKFPRTFWVANTIELFERWAWYGFFMLFANYLTGSSDLGGLEFSQSQKGMLMGVGTAILYFLPVLTGAIADRYGYKKVLFLSFIIYVSAFILLPMFSTFTGVFLMYLYLAVGAALFKPIIQATVAKTTTDETSSIGFGIFYMMVNVGAFFGPMVTLLFKGSSHLIFYVSAGIIMLNFLLLPFYKEPGRNETEKQKSPILQTFSEIFRNMGTILKDGKFIIFLCIVAGFWAMYHQLFFTLPVFVSQWVDTSALYTFFQTYIPFISDNYSPAPGVMDAEFVTNMDAFYIILFQVLVSSLVMKLKPLHSMITGFLVCSIGMALTFMSQNVLFTLVAILIFGLGEMAGSPKISEYIGRIAPADKKALYMGYSFIPVFLGNLLAGIISGVVYQKMSDKVELSHRFVTEKGLQIQEGLSTNAYFEEVARQVNLSPHELTNLLWETYNPSHIWMVLLAIGLIAVVCLFIYDRIINKEQ